MADASRLRRVLRGWRMRAGAAALDGAFTGLSRIARLHPRARPSAHGVERVADLRYRPGGDAAHLLDVYRPAGATGPLPVVLYVHGGGFRLLSKETHFAMALRFARRGYLVFNVNYRLAPRHPFPAAIEDVCAALAWVAEHAGEHGGDLGRLVLAGESAGANLVTALAVATSYRRPEPWARVAFDAGASARAVVAACGILQVSDTERFVRRRQARGKSMSLFLQDRVYEVEHAYLGRAAGLDAPGARDLADPLIALERGHAPDRPLPAFYAPVGTRDLLLDDTRRLSAALERLGAVCRASYFPGELHAFHALPGRPAARRCWHETFDFLDEHLAATVESTLEVG